MNPIVSAWLPQFFSVHPWSSGSKCIPQPTLASRASALRPSSPSSALSQSAWGALSVSRTARATACSFSKKLLALSGWATQAHAKRDTSSGTKSANLPSAHRKPFSKRSAASELLEDFTREAADQHVRANDAAENSWIRSRLELKIVDVNLGSTGAVSASKAHAPAHSSNFRWDTSGWCKTACTCHTILSSSPPSCKPRKDWDKKRSKCCCRAGVVRGGLWSSATKLFNASKASCLSGFLSWFKDATISCGKYVTCSNSVRWSFRSFSESAESSSSESHFLYHLSMGAMLVRPKVRRTCHSARKTPNDSVPWRSLVGPGIIIVCMSWPRNELFQLCPNRKPLVFLIQRALGKQVLTDVTVAAVSLVSRCWNLQTTPSGA